MEIAFDAIGLEILSETAFNNLAEDAEKRGEASQLARQRGVLQGYGGPRGRRVRARAG